jgi:aspartyl protease family protein
VNDADQALNFIYLLGLLVLVVSAFLTRRIPIRQSLRMAASWLLIFAALFVAFAVKDDLAALGKRVISEARGDGEIVEAGKEIRIRKSSDGHFWVRGEINGQQARFLVDSGATVTSISEDTARRARVEPTDSIPAMVQTANGMIQVQSGRASLVVGSIARHDMTIHMSDAFGDTDVLGMNFLSSLRGWSVEGDRLVLKP